MRSLCSFAVNYSRFFTKTTPGEIRTHDLLLRRQALYPAELRAHLRQPGSLSAGCGWALCEPLAEKSISCSATPNRRSDNMLSDNMLDGPAGWRYIAARWFAVAAHHFLFRTRPAWPNSPPKLARLDPGDVTERLIVPVSKTGVPKRYREFDATAPRSESHPLR